MRHLIEERHLWPVKNSPPFKLPAWMVYLRDNNNATLKQALVGLRKLARAEQAAGRER